MSAVIAHMSFLFLYYNMAYKKYINNRMPRINRKQIKEKSVKYKSEKKELSASFYDSLAWKRLRNTYISLHPLCECCLEHNKVEAATEVHHKRPWSRGESEEEKWQLFLDERNLMSLCQQCHLALHMKDREYGLSSLDELTETEWKYAKGLNY